MSTGYRLPRPDQRTRTCRLNRSAASSPTGLSPRFGRLFHAVRLATHQHGQVSFHLAPLMREKSQIMGPRRAENVNLGLCHHESRSSATILPPLAKRRSADRRDSTLSVPSSNRYNVGRTGLMFGSLFRGRSLSRTFPCLTLPRQSETRGALLARCFHDEHRVHQPLRRGPMICVSILKEPKRGERLNRS